jgi:hypothetical protein
MTVALSDRKTTGIEAIDPDGEISHPLPGRRTISRPMGVSIAPALLVPDGGLK